MPVSPQYETARWFQNGFWSEWSFKRWEVVCWGEETKKEETGSDPERG